MGLFDALAAPLRELDPAGFPVPYVNPAVTDARFFAKLGIQTYGYTPLHLPDDFSFIGTIHAADERVPVAALEFGAQAVYKAMQRFH
jgi:acetylornithine deacetylase/succinyl-diaminopimelate desuccinylase-like protein